MMRIKSAADEIENYLRDASNMAGGFADKVLLPDSTEEVASALRDASHTRTPVTIAGAGTGIVGGRVPFGGIVISTERLNQIGPIERSMSGGTGQAGAGVLLDSYVRETAKAGLLYPPDPTEWSCSIGGTVATNASGARTFKYGPTRNYVERLEVALSSGEILDIERGRFFADEQGRFSIDLASGNVLSGQVPGYSMPRTRKNASGYFAKPGMDMIDLFIGSEGTLGVVTTVLTRLLPLPQDVLGAIVFFRTEKGLLDFVREARSLSLDKSSRVGLEARAIEYFDPKSLSMLREKFTTVPEETAGAIFFEQELDGRDEERVMEHWLQLMEQSGAMVEESWFGTNEADRKRLREFRHALPVQVNEWLAHHGQRKVSTDMAVPDDEFADMLAFYVNSLAATKLNYVIFGHIGDNHLHVNILPRDDEEAAAARGLYLQFVERAVAVGGTVSAEHGIGKLKRDYLRVLYGDRFLREMAGLKHVFDPAGILGRGIMFNEEFI
jgi:D-lactate dehydrogenase (cytochrome)